MKRATRTPAVSGGRAKPLTDRQQVDAYLAAAAPAARPMLRTLRRLIRAAAPKAGEKLSYGMPYYHHQGRLIYFAAFTRHIGLYVMGAAKERFAAEMKPYRTTASTLQFPLGTRIPARLVTKLVKARVSENEIRAAGARKPAKRARR